MNDGDVVGRVLKALSAHPVSAKEIASHVDLSVAQVSQALSMLVREGAACELRRDGSVTFAHAGMASAGLSTLRRESVLATDYHDVVASALAEFGLVIDGETRESRDGTARVVQKASPSTNPRIPTVAAKTSHGGGNTRSPRSGRTSESLKKRIVSETSRRPVVAALLKIDPGLEQQVCTACGEGVALWVGRYGPYLRCADRECGKSESVDSSLVEAALAMVGIGCEKCGGKLEQQKGRYGAYLKCVRCQDGEGWSAFKKRIRKGLPTRNTVEVEKRIAEAWYVEVKRGRFYLEDARKIALDLGATELDDESIKRLLKYVERLGRGFPVEGTAPPATSRRSAQEPQPSAGRQKSSSGRRETIREACLRVFRERGSPLHYKNELARLTKRKADSVGAILSMNPEFRSLGDGMWELIAEDE